MCRHCWTSFTVARRCLHGQEIVADDYAIAFFYGVFGISRVSVPYSRALGDAGSFRGSFLVADRTKPAPRL